MPGTVRCEIDLTRLQQRDMVWNGATKTISISLPGLGFFAPKIDLREIREYGGGGVLEALTNAEDALETRNRQAAQAELRAAIRRSSTDRAASRTC